MLTPVMGAGSPGHLVEMQLHGLEQLVYNTINLFILRCFLSVKLQFLPMYYKPCAPLYQVRLTTGSPCITKLIPSRANLVVPLLIFLQCRCVYIGWPMYSLIFFLISFFFCYLVTSRFFLFFRLLLPSVVQVKMK